LARYRVLAPFTTSQPLRDLAGALGAKSGSISREEAYVRTVGHSYQLFRGLPLG